MDKLTVISGCLFLAADIFAIASIANPDWISTGDSAGRFPHEFFLALNGALLTGPHWGDVSRLL